MDKNRVNWEWFTLIKKLCNLGGWCRVLRWVTWGLRTVVQGSLMVLYKWGRESRSTRERMSFTLWGGVQWDSSEGPASYIGYLPAYSYPAGADTASRAFTAPGVVMYATWSDLGALVAYFHFIDGEAPFASSASSWIYGFWSIHYFPLPMIILAALLLCTYTVNYESHWRNASFISIIIFIITVH